MKPEQAVSQSNVPRDHNDNLFDRKLFIGFDLNFSGLLECLLLDEGDLII